MLNVTSATKKAFMSDVSKKTLRIWFPDLSVQYTNDSIETESLKITESISTKDSVEFVGCIASSLQISIYGIEENIKGKWIEVYISADGTDEIPLFKGIVDSVVIDSNKYFKKITAYDVLYDKTNVEVVDWYNGLFPTEDTQHTLKEIRDSIFRYLGINQVDIELPNDALVIKKEYEPKTLKGLNVLKAICQINGACGIINRNGYFDYRFITSVVGGMHPALTLYPSNTTFPQVSNIAHTFAFYEKLDFEEYYVRPMQQVQIRENENDSGVIVGTGTNKYIIQSNMFAKGIVPSILNAAANNILNRLKEVEFFPFKSKNNGLPFIEVGDAVVYVLNKNRSGRYATNSFFVLSRTLSGVQLLKDEYSAVGDEKQSEFITDLQTTLDTLKMSGGGGGGDLSDYYTKEDVNDILTDYTTQGQVEEQVTTEVAQQVNQMEKPTGFTVVSTYTLPINRTNNTIYLIQGGVIIQ